MPRGDGTGPNGMGSMTGRGAGFCAGYNVPGYANPVGGRGMGGGFGFGRGRGGGGGFGRRNMFYATGLPGWQRADMGMPAWAGVAPMQAPFPAAPTKEQQIEALKGQAASLETALEGIRDRMSELETE